jgi:hypothetical protein
MVQEIIESAFDKVMRFLTRFQPLLEIYWRNKQVDLGILVHERLRNPVESLGNTIRLFNFYHTYFSSNLPSMTDIDFIAQIEQSVPKIIRERTDISKKWLRKALSDLSRPVSNVEEFVEQKGHLNYVNDNFQNVRDSVDLYG